MTDAIVKALLDIAKELTASDKTAATSVKLIKFDYAGPSTISLVFHGVVMEQGYYLGTEKIKQKVQDIEQAADNLTYEIKRSLENGAIGCANYYIENSTFFLKQDLYVEIQAFIPLLEFQPEQAITSKIISILKGYTR
jgi:hypothetical protein